MSKLTVEEKFAKAVIRLRNIRPFYAAIYEAIEKVRKDSVGTIGVTQNKIIYNYAYIDKAEFDDFMFSILHEIAHIALMHVVRMENRNMQLWNIACDLFVNKLLCEEFDLKPGITNTTYDIRMKHGLVYDPYVDTECDIVEEIYDHLKKEADKQGYSSDTDPTKVYRVTTSTKSYNNYIEFNKDTPGDMLDDGSDYIKKDDECRKILVDAITRYEMLGNKTPGNQPGKLEEFVDKILESKVDWKKLLRKYCVQYVTKDLSFSTPDKRMYYQNAIYPGSHSEGHEVLKNVKVCIDTSGSISEEDLGYFFGQILQLVKTFNTSVEVLNWDTEIESVYELTKNEVHSESKYKVTGRGGTDPSCLFEYFDSRKCKVKPFVVLIFTDGWIDTDFKSSWARKYKNTIWIMTKEHNASFKPDFGKIAYATFND